MTQPTTPRPTRFAGLRQPTGWFRYYVTVVCRHWIVFLPVLLIVPLVVGGLLGRGLGIQYLFRDQTSPFDPAFAADSAWWLPVRLLGSAYFETQGYAVALFGLLWTCCLLVEIRYNRLDQTYLPRESRVLHYLPGTALLAFPTLIAAMLQLGLSIWNYGKLPWHMLALPPVGFALGLIFFYVTSKVAFALAGWLKWSKITVVLLITMLLIVVALHFPVVLPAKLMFMVIATSIVVYTALQLAGPTTRVLVLGGTLVGLVVLNGFRSEKYSFPELETHYEKALTERPTLRSYQLSNRRVTMALDLSRRKALECAAADDQVGTGLIDPVVGLQHWYRTVVGPAAQTTAPVAQPKLVIIATSGGAYRASYWTARIIELLMAEDRPAGALPGFRRNIRLLTGASGGMVASAYLAAENPAATTHTPIADQIRTDVKSALDNRASWQHPLTSVIRNPLASDWDSLSPVARQMVLGDMPGFASPFALDTDRGRELERHWKTLGVTFSSLREAEARGLRPSLVLSPTIADTGLPLLISNLDLSSVYRDSNEAVELFKLLPGAEGRLKVQTAVRMSATFPFISPSTRLPTNPPHRVVDAGYYDNFGIGVASSYLHEPAIKSWLKRCTSGVMVVQIRAWPQDTTAATTTDEGLIAKWMSTFAWVTTPIEGVANARATTNFFHNRRQLCALQDIYRDQAAGPRQGVNNECQDDKDFLQTVAFEPEKLDGDASFTWDLQRRELDEMATLLHRPNITHAQAALAKFWAADLK